MWGCSGTLDLKYQFWNHHRAYDGYKHASRLKTKGGKAKMRGGVGALVNVAQLVRDGERLEWLGAVMVSPPSTKQCGFDLCHLKAWTYN